MRPRFYAVVLVSFIFMTGVHESLVDKQTAEEVATNWQTYQLRDTQTIDKLFPIEYGKNTVVYAFTFENNNGFVFVSGNDAQSPPGKFPVKVHQVISG